MKKLLFILVLFLILPCALVFTGCGKDEKPKAIKDIEVGDGNQQGTFISYSYTYGEEITFIESSNLKLYMVFEDNSKREFTIDEYSQHTEQISKDGDYVDFDIFSLRNTKLDVGFYTLKLGYSNMNCYIYLTILSANVPTASATIRVLDSQTKQATYNNSYDFGKGEIVNGDSNQWFYSGYALQITHNARVVKSDDIIGVYLLSEEEKLEYDAKLTDAEKIEYLKDHKDRYISYNGTKVEGSDTLLEIYTQNTSIAPGIYYSFALIDLPNYKQFYSIPGSDSRIVVNKGSISLKDALVEDNFEYVSMISSQIQNILDSDVMTSEQKEEQIKYIYSNKTSEEIAAMTMQEYIDYLTGDGEGTYIEWLENNKLTVYDVGGEIDKETTLQNILNYFDITALFSFTDNIGTWNNPEYILDDSLTLGKLNEYSSQNRLSVFRANFRDNARFKLVINGSTIGVGSVVEYLQFKYGETEVSFKNRDASLTSFNMNAPVLFNFAEGSGYDTYYNITDNQFYVTLHVEKGIIDAPYSIDYSENPDSPGNYILNVSYDYGNSIAPNFERIYSSNWEWVVDNDGERFVEVIVENPFIIIPQNMKKSEIGNYSTTFTLKDTINFVFREIEPEEAYRYGTGDATSRTFEWHIVKKALDSGQPSLISAQPVDEYSSRYYIEGDDETTYTDLYHIDYSGSQIEIPVYLTVVGDEYFKYRTENAGELEGFSWQITFDSNEVSASLAHNLTTNDATIYTFTFDPNNEIESEKTCFAIANALTISNLTGDGANVIITVSFAGDDNFESFQQEFYIYIALVS